MNKWIRTGEMEYIKHLSDNKYGVVLVTTENNQFILINPIVIDLDKWTDTETKQPNKKLQDLIDERYFGIEEIETSFPDIKDYILTSLIVNNTPLQKYKTFSTQNDAVQYMDYIMQKLDLNSIYGSDMVVS